jgi:exodeoxyribonuclease VII large subunit
MSNNQHNVHEFSVSELANALKQTVEDGFSHVRVRGELSGVSHPRSGHVYMTLKDESAVLDGVCWRGVAARLSFKPEDGLEVICTGKLTTYPARSKYQLVIDHMEPAGAGALMALLEERKKKLANEGLFSSAGKKPIPFIPKVIGVVTSPTGAVIKDILHRLADRFPRHVLLWPVKVQGDGAAEAIAQGIEGFNAMTLDGKFPRPDLIIVARGGGSIEDLWAFNEEVVVRAVAASDIPLISAVGHETDTTLIDFASDHRSPTPTAAAERAVPVLADLQYTLGDFSTRLVRAKGRYFEQLEKSLDSLSRGLPRPVDILGLKEQRLDDLSERLPSALRAVVRENETSLAKVCGGLSVRALKQTLAIKKLNLDSLVGRVKQAGVRVVFDNSQKLDALNRLLSSLSFERVLERGYAAIFDDRKKPITSVAAISAGMNVEVRLKDGQFAAEVAGERDFKRVPKPKSKPKPQTKQTKSDDKQGKLL